MAPAIKKRKLSHGGDDEEDASSFASFSNDEAGSDSASLDEAMDDVDGSDEESNASHADSDEEGSDEEPDTTAAAIQPVVAANGKAQKQQPRPRDTAAVSALNRTGGDQKASMLGLQIEELLGQVRPKKTSRAATAAVECVHELKAAIEQLKPRAPLSIVEAERTLIKKGRVATPFPDPRPAHDAQYKLEFKSPTSINVVGSFVSGTAPRSSKALAVDLMVQMPNDMFQDKDYLDYRYFYRRAYYLACIAAGLRTSTAGKYLLSFESQNGNPLSPILTVKPAEGEPAGKWQVNILPSIGPKVFNDERLLPSKSLVRQQADDNTSLYNSSIQADRQTTAYLKLIHSASASCDDFKDTTLLLRVWLQQRGFASSIQAGGFGGFEAAALVAVLLSLKSISPRYSTYQLFKATLQFLVTKDCAKGPISLGETAATLAAIPSTPVLYDAARSHNLLFKMSSWSYKALRQQARTTLNMLSDAHSDSFEPAFILREDISHLKYDILLALPSQLLSGQASYDHQVLADQTKLCSILTRGLGDRITLIDVRTDALSSWDLGSARPSWSTKGETVIALRLNSANAMRTVDHGPSAEDKVAAAEFRKFWGERAELRRFKDGSILESLVWSAKSGEQALILEIVTCLIERHFGSASAAALRVLGGDVSRMIANAQGTAAFQPVLDEFKTLENDIRALDELPLTIRQVTAAGPQACFASLQPPTASSQPVDVVLQFESSARWPDDLKAVQRTKAAFLLKISSLLKEANPELVSRVGLENTTSPALNQSFIDITYPVCTFRLRIFHERESRILQRMLKDKTTGPAERDAATAALAQHKRDFLALPAHTSSMVKLSTRFPPLSATTRLLKKWFASHLLLSHFPAPIIEAIAANIFLHPAPYPVPGSAKSAFYRCLAFLARWDWQKEPLVLLDPAAEKADNAALYANARTRFAAWRRLDPGLNRVVLFVASSADADGTAWTDIAAGGPGRVVAARMTQLAAAAVEVVRTAEWDLEPETLFASSLADYDFVIRLAAKKRVENGFKNLAIATGKVDRSGFDAVQMYLDELRGLYGGSVVFFYGGKGGDVIAGLWNPATEKRAWKVSLEYSTVPVEVEDGEVEAVANKEAMLAEMARLGGDLVAKIEVK